MRSQKELQFKIALSATGVLPILEVYEMCIPSFPPPPIPLVCCPLACHVKVPQVTAPAPHRMGGGWIRRTKILTQQMALVHCFSHSFLLLE